MLARAVLLIVALAGEPAAPPDAPPPDAAPAPRTDRSAQLAYMDKRIAFQVVREADGADLFFPARLATVPTMGRSRTPLLGARFYEVIGRDDLASAYRVRSIRRNVLIVSGLAVALGGTVYALTAPSPDASSGVAEFTRQVRAQDRAERIAMGITAGGMLVAAIGAFTNPNPVDDGEMRRLAEEYNGRLRNTLGLSAASDFQADGAERPRISFAAGAAPGGAVAGMTVAF